MSLGAIASKPDQTATLGFALSLFVWLMMPCLCGHYGAHALIGAVPGALLAWTGFTRNQSTRLIARCGFALVVIATTFLLLKVVLDILWTGHEPLLSQPVWFERWLYWEELKTR